MKDTDEDVQIYLGQKKNIVFIGENRMWRNIRLMQHLGLRL